MKNGVYGLLVCLTFALAALGWVGWGLHDAKDEIVRLTEVNKQSDTLSLTTIRSLQEKLGDCQRDKVDSLPAPNVEKRPKVVMPKIIAPKKKIIHRKPSRRFATRHAQREPRDRAPPHSNDWTHAWGLWGFWGL
jgi:hypothetical protein